jgi:hypothetical protein
MAQAHELSADPLGGHATSAPAAWLFSWPLLTGIFAYLYALNRANDLFLDGDTYWHVATGRWILSNGTVPKVDPFSHTMPGAPWTAHEWLSDVIMAGAHQIGGWNLVAVIIALAFAGTIALLTRTLLRWLEPIYALLFAGLAVSMSAGHLLARPHLLAMPLMMIWTIELVRASDSKSSPRLWMLPIMTLWANLHGGFTLGIALVCAFAAEALLVATQEKRVAMAKSWGIFLVLTLASALVTPHGAQGILYTWDLLFEHPYALERVGEWHSPNFHTFQPLELWLLGGLALVMYQGLRLPLVRLILLLGVLHLSLKHQRNIELVGLLAPLFLAAPFAAQWRRAQGGKQQFQVADRLFSRLVQPAGRGALLLAFLVVLVAPVWLAHARPLAFPEGPVPARAVSAVQQAGIKGRVLNSYISGGYLIYMGFQVFIDGRGDMYGDTFMKEYLEALELKTSDGLENLLRKYEITWTLLERGHPAVALLDHLPQWRRLYTDDTAVVHIRVPPSEAPLTVSTGQPTQSAR